MMTFDSYCGSQHYITARIALVQDLRKASYHACLFVLSVSHTALLQVCSVVGVGKARGSVL